MKLADLKKRVSFALPAVVISWWIINSNISFFSLFPSSIMSNFPFLSKIHIFPGHILTMVIIFFAASEYIAMLSKIYPVNGFWLIYLWLCFQIFSYFYPENLLTVKYDTFILFLLVALESFIWGKYSSRWKRASLLFSGTVILIIACFSIFDFYAEYFQRLFPPHFKSVMLSQLGIIFVAGAIFICDTNAYFVGSLFGKHHYSSLSPNKTIEGSVAGLVSAVITVTIGWYFFADSRYSIVYGIILGILVGFFAIIGDHLVSLIKRYFNVKDSSSMIPGHGGIMDRFGSVFFAAPVINLYSTLLHKLVQ